MSYHIDINGEPAQCSASVQKCPREHYATIEEAEQAIETQNSNKLFAPHSKLLTNTLDDAFQVPQRDDRTARDGDGLSLPEEIAVDDQKAVEKDIAKHKKSVAQGYNPRSLDELSKPRASAKFGDTDGITLAWYNQDYDKVRELYAQAHVRRYSRDPDFQLDARDLIVQARR